MLADVINNLRDIRRVKDFGESELILKLSELGVKTSISRNKCYSRCIDGLTEGEMRPPASVSRVQ